MADHESSEINDVAPSSIRHLIGQEGVVAQVLVAMDAAFADDRRFDDALLVGPPGVGKSALAQVIACEMATTLHEVLGQSIKTPADLNGLILAAKDKDIVHIDECHELAKPYQTALYRAIDKREIVISGSRNAPYSLPLHDFTLLLSSTDEHALLAPLRDRMKMVLRFEFYAEAELTTVLLQRTRALRWEVQEQVLPMIAQRARGTPRLALRLLQSCRRVCRAEGENTITVEHLQRACELEQLDDLGLGPTDQRYLHAVVSGASRLNVIASVLGLPAKTVSQVIEPFLIRVSLVVKDDQGRRELTGKGREHLNLPQKSS